MGQRSGEDRGVKVGKRKAIEVSNSVQFCIAGWAVGWVRFAVLVAGAEADALIPACSHERLGVRARGRIAAHAEEGGWELVLRRIVRPSILTALAARFGAVR